MSRILLHKRFVKSYCDNNNNKYWYITVYDTGDVKTEWGRIGNTIGQSQIKSYSSCELAKQQAEKQIKTKLKGKTHEPPYVEVDIVDVQPTSYTQNRSLEDVIIQSLGGTPEIDELLRYLVQQNKHSILDQTTMTYNDTTGLFSTPVGIVSRQTIQKARNLLVQLSHDLEEKITEKEYIAHIEEYLMFIPQKIKDMRHVQQLFSTSEQLLAQNNILDALDGSLDIVENMSQSSHISSSLPNIQTSICVLDDQQEFQRVNRLFQSTLQSQHSSSSLKLYAVYPICVQKLFTEYQQHLLLGNILELFHGSQTANCLSLLLKGYMSTPPGTVKLTGKMFGDFHGTGIYLSDQSTKSLNYSTGYWSGTRRTERTFMFLNDVIMGNIFYPKSQSEAKDVDSERYHSIYVKGGTCGVFNNEMVVPIQQINMKYLLEFRV